MPQRSEQLSRGFFQRWPNDPIREMDKYINTIVAKKKKKKTIILNIIIIIITAKVIEPRNINLNNVGSNFFANRK